MTSKLRPTFTIKFGRKPTSDERYYLCPTQWANRQVILRDLFIGPLWFDCGGCRQSYHAMCDCDVSQCWERFDKHPEIERRSEYVPSAATKIEEGAEVVFEEVRR